MYLKNLIKIVVLVAGLMVVLLLVGCFGNNSDEIKITEISKNIEKALEEKDTDLFMENISADYSDPNGGSYNNHLHNLPENLLAQIGLVETLFDPFPGLKVITSVSITELIITEPYTSGKIKITISLKWCLGFCITFPGTEDKVIEYNVDFQKENEDWKIISMIEI
jgi:hypothetical protein